MTQLREIFSGTLWVVAARWGIRAIGLVSTIVLARVLAPEDFGVVALAMLVVAMVEMFGDAGLALYVIRHPDPQRSHFDTIFTLLLIMGIGLAALVFVAAPWAAVFFREPKLEVVLQWLALRPLLVGLENPGIIWFRKNMTFGKEFEFLVLNKLVAFVVTIGAALVLRDYWALVIGILSGAVVCTLQSYRMHPFRPRLSLSRAREVWGFSAWMMLVQVLDFVNTRVDEIIVGRVRTTTEMGFYNVGSDIAAMPVQEIVYPMTRVWVPGFARLAHDPVALEQTYRWVMSAVAILALSISTGLALVAHDFTLLVLGAQWLPAVPVIQILAIAAGLSSLAMPLGSVLGATGDPRLSVGLALVRSVLLIATMVPAALWYTLAEVAMGRLLATTVALLVSMVVFERFAGLPHFTLLRGMVRPFLAALAMSAAVLLVQHLSPDLVLLRLAMSVGAGVVVFGVTLLGAWVMVGRPPSVEHDVLKWSSDRITEFRRKAL